MKNELKDWLIDIIEYKIDELRTDIDDFCNHIII